MGYRSEVGYVIRFASKEDLDTFIGVQVVKKDETVTSALKELALIESTQTEQYLYFYASDVKWYSDYPDVKVHHDFMHSAVEMFEDSAWLFLRCGEQYDDVEEESGGDDGWDLQEFISICRPTINIDVGNTKPILTEEGELV